MPDEIQVRIPQDPVDVGLFVCQRHPEGGEIDAVRKGKGGALGGGPPGGETAAILRVNQRKTVRCADCGFFYSLAERADAKESVRKT